MASLQALAAVLGWPPEETDCRAVSCLTRKGRPCWHQGTFSGKGQLFPYTNSSSSSCHNLYFTYSLFPPQMIERLWNITETLNVLYKDNWTVMANVELIQFQSELTVSLGRVKGEEGCQGVGERRPGMGRDFSLTRAFFYCLSLATTVGRATSVPGITLTSSCRL